MNKIVCLLLGITIVLLTACGAPPAAGNDSSGGYVAPAEPVNPPINSVPSEPVESATNSSTNGSEIFLPNGKGKAPSGILDQLSWQVGGGGRTARTCGECDTYVRGKNLEIYSFAPYQNLKLFFYRRIGETNACGIGIAEFVTTAQVQVDGNGSLNLPLSGAVDNIYVNSVIDVDSGQVIIPGSTELDTSCTIDDLSSCPGAPQQRVQNGGSAYVCTQRDRLIVRSQPSSGTNELIRLEPGTQLNITGGPECSDNMSWWKIETNGITGWVAEGGDNVDPYYICPAQ